MEFAQALRQTRDNLITLLNSSGLPIDVIDLLLKDVQRTIHDQAEREYKRLLKNENKNEEVD